MTNAELQAMLDEPSEKAIAWLRDYRDGSEQDHDCIILDALINLMWSRLPPKEERRIRTTLQAEHTPLEEAEWAYGKGLMPSALSAFLSHPEANGAVARALAVTQGQPTGDRVSAILAELKKMTDRGWGRTR